MEENNEKSEPTYWETQASSSTPDTTQAPIENTQAPQENPFLQPHKPQPFETKRKTPKALVAVIIIMVIIGAGAAVAFAFKDRLMNTIALSSKSPKEYFVDLQQKQINEQLDSLTSNLDFSPEVAQKTNVEITYNKELVDTLLSTTGMSISDIESQLGITLDSIGFDSTIIGDENAYYGQLGLILNKKSLISAEIFLDFLAKDVSLLIPELSDAILNYNLGETAEDIGFDSSSLSQEKINALKKNIKEEEVTEFIKHYTTIILESMDDVELEKGVTYSIDDIDVTANRLTVVIDAKTVQKIAIEVLKELKKDSYVQSFLPIFEVSKEEYQNSIDLAISYLEIGDMANEDGNATIELYVDQNGTSLGSRIKLNYDGDVLSYGHGQVTKGNKSNYEYYIADDEENSKIEITGSHTKEGNAYTGEADLTIHSDGAMSVTISYDDFETSIRNGVPYYDGKVEFTSILFMGISLGVDMSSNGNTQEVDFNVSMAKENLFNINIITESLKNASVPSSPKDAVTYDMETEMDLYTSTIDVEGFLASLSEKLGVNVSDLFGAYFYNGLY